MKFSEFKNIILKYLVSNWNSTKETPYRDSILFYKTLMGYDYFNFDQHFRKFLLDNKTNDVYQYIFSFYCSFFIIDYNL